MKSTLRARMFVMMAGGALLIGCASTPRKPDVVAMGHDTYSITRQASSGFSRNTEKMKAEITADAKKFCTDHGKVMKVISLTDERPMYAMGYANAKIVFQALDAGDPQLTSAAPAPAAMEPAATPPAAASGPGPADDLYTELTKLDELRQKGILTEKEFQAEKKKILNRSR